MQFRFAILLALAVPVTLSASTSFSLGNNPPDQSFTSDGNVEGDFTTTTYSGSTSQNIICMVAMADTSLVCGSPGNSADNVSLNNAPSSSPSGSDYILADGDPQWGAPVWVKVTGLVIGNQYTVTFYESSNEEKGATPITAYDDQWELYLLSGTTGAYICPQSYCTTYATQTTTGTQVGASTVMDNPGGTSTPWVSQSISFTDTTVSGNGVLEFVTNVTNATGSSFVPPFLGLADVTFSDPPSAPEPGTGLLMAIGLGLVVAGAGLRRRFATAKK